MKLNLEVDGVRLTKAQRSILQKIRISPLSQREIARSLTLAESSINHDLEKLSRLGLLELKGKKPKFAVITDLGKRFVNSYPGISLGRPVVRLHRVQLTAQVIKKPDTWNLPTPTFYGVSDALHMKGWKRQTRGFHGQDIFLISDSSLTLILRGGIIADDSILAVNEAAEIFIEFAKDLEETNPGFKLGKPYEGFVLKVSSQHYAFPLPNGDRFIKPSRFEKFVIDWSKGYPEIEFIDKKTAIDDSKRYSDFVNRLLDGRIDPFLIDSDNLRTLYSANSASNKSTNSVMPDNN